jgi:ribosomal protein S18 acetylase RimI-like enzyme
MCKSVITVAPECTLHAKICEYCLSKKVMLVRKKLNFIVPVVKSPTMELRIRQLTNANFAAVKVLFRKAFAEEIYPYEDLDQSWIERSKPDSFGFFYQGNLIGFVIASYHVRNKSNMYIDYLALDPEFRGNGIGSFLLKLLIGKCYKKNGSMHLYPEREELLSWYTRHGFCETSKNYFVFHSYGTRKQHAIHKSLGL